MVRAVEWRGDRLRMLDQNALPRRERYVVARGPRAVAEAIAVMTVRGAPLLGVTAAYGMALAALRSEARTRAALIKDLERAGRLLVGARPTAVNVSWAVDLVLGAARRAAVDAPRGEEVEAVRRATVAEADRIAAADEASCAAIARLGADLVPPNARILTHCNTGSLATYGDGTAQGIVAEAHRRGRVSMTWVDETRPRRQGARLTAWELQRLGVPMTLVADTVAGSLMGRGLVDLVVLGADRIAANGDTANKIGTYQLAVLARAHRIPFYVAAPLSTVDVAITSGADIVIEERDPSEVTAPDGTPVAPPGTPAANPAFDVTPARLVTAIVTDRGVARPPLGRALSRLSARSNGSFAAAGAERRRVSADTGRAGSR
jgi:methylthioribose-1-phosphate isomerase